MGGSVAPIPTDEATIPGYAPVFCPAMTGQFVARRSRTRNDDGAVLSRLERTLARVGGARQNAFGCLDGGPVSVVRQATDVGSADWGKGCARLSRQCRSPPQGGTMSQVEDVSTQVMTSSWNLRPNRRGRPVHRCLIPTTMTTMTTDRCRSHEACRA